MNMKKTSLIVLLLAQSLCSVSSESAIESYDLQSAVIGENSESDNKSHGIQPMTQQIMSTMYAANKWALDNALRWTRGPVAAVVKNIPILSGLFSSAGSSTPSKVNPVVSTEQPAPVQFVGAPAFEGFDPLRTVRPPMPRKAARVSRKGTGSKRVPKSKLVPRPKATRPAGARAFSTQVKPVRTLQSTSAKPKLRASKQQVTPKKAIQSSIEKVMRAVKEPVKGAAKLAKDSAKKLKTVIQVEKRVVQKAVVRQAKIVGGQVEKRLQSALWDASCAREGAQEGVKVVAEVKDRAIARATDAVKTQFERVVVKAKPVVEKAQVVKATIVEPVTKVVTKSKTTAQVKAAPKQLGFAARALRSTVKALGPNGMKFAAGALELVLPMAVEGLINQASSSIGNVMNGSAAKGVATRAVSGAARAGSTAVQNGTRRMLTTASRSVTRFGRKPAQSMMRASRFVGSKGNPLTRIAGLAGSALAMGVASFFGR